MVVLRRQTSEDISAMTKCVCELDNAIVNNALCFDFVLVLISLVTVWLFSLMIL